MTKIWPPAGRILVLGLGAAVAVACSSVRRDANRAREAVRPGMAWPEAVVAAEQAVCKENPVICSCVPASGEGFYFFRSPGGAYLIQSPDGTQGYKTQQAWRDALRDFGNNRCQRLLVTVRRDQFEASIGPEGRVLSVSRVD